MRLDILIQLYTKFLKKPFFNKLYTQNIIVIKLKNFIYI